MITYAQKRLRPSWTERAWSRARGTHIVACAMALLCSVGATAPLTDVDEIVARHIDALGGHEKIKAIRSLVYSQGLYEEGDYKGSGDAWMARMRPYYRVVGNPENPGGFMEGYDGAAWEWYANPGIALRTVGAAAAASRHGANIESSLIDYREKGATVKLGEPVDFDGQPAYRLHLTVRDDFAVDVFIDQSTFLVVAERLSAPIHAFGKAITSETRVGDYRRIGGVLMPHHYRETEIASGKLLSEMRWGKIEVNRELPTTWFSPPEFSRTRLQAFMEHLYGERTDIEAIMWTYHEFRREYPDIDTREAVEVVGYQMLKMGAVEESIALLETNAEDYSNAATSAFALGRAYLTAGEHDKARAELQRALLLDPNNRRSAAMLESMGQK